MKEKEFLELLVSAMLWKAEDRQRLQTLEFLIRHQYVHMVLKRDKK